MRWGTPGSARRGGRGRVHLQVRVPRAAESFSAQGRAARATSAATLVQKPSDETFDAISRIVRRLLCSCRKKFRKNKTEEGREAAFESITFGVPAHLGSSPTHNALSGWLKRNGGLAEGKRGVPRASQSSEPCVYSCLHTSPTFFIYLLWNIYGCYERFKIMCLWLSPARSPPRPALFYNA